MQVSGRPSFFSIGYTAAQKRANSIVKWLSRGYWEKRIVKKEDDDENGLFLTVHISLDQKTVTNGAYYERRTAPHNDDESLA